MKIRFIAILGSLILNNQVAQATHLSSESNQKNASQTSPNRLKQMSADFMYSYIDFNFNSTVNDNFNRFQGHSNVYSLGADHVVINKTLFAGLYVFNVNTSVESQFLLIPSLPTTTSQSIHNNTLFGHLRQSFTPEFDIDLAAGYGQNKISSTSLFLAGSNVQDVGFSNTHNTNWFTTVNAFYKKTWHKIQLRPNVGVLYSQINSGSYPFTLRSGLPTQIIGSLTNKVTYITEGIEFGYSATPSMTPFINGALIQVAQYSNSRPVITTPINGSLPQLNMNKNGYRLGAGVTFNHKQFSLRLEEKYYNASKTFTSNQTTVGLEYRFS